MNDDKSRLSLLRHRDFCVFWTGSFLSSIGTQFTTVAMAWQIYELTNSALQIVAFEHVREVAYRPWAEQTIPRRFCTGRVLVSDGKKRRIHYWIGEDTGIIGASWGVEWCVVGLDRNWAYNPGCQMAQP